jgi:hypothetical protein
MVDGEVHFPYADPGAVVQRVLQPDDAQQKQQLQQFPPAVLESQYERGQRVYDHHGFGLALELDEFLDHFLLVALVVGEDVIYFSDSADQLRNIIDEHLVRVKESPYVVEEGGDGGAFEENLPEGDVRLFLHSKQWVDDVGGDGDVNEVAGAMLLQRHVEEGECEEDHADYFAVDGEEHFLLFNDRLFRRVTHCLAFLFLHIQLITNKHHHRTSPSTYSIRTSYFNLIKSVWPDFIDG